MKKLLLILAALPLSASLAQGEPLAALTAANELIRFNSATPGTVDSTVAITGLTAGDVLVGIDVRPANNTLYGFAVNGAVGRVYSLNLTTGAATLAPALAADPADTTAPFPFTSVSGSFFGVDFNPVADRLRVVSDAGQNLRINVDSGATQLDGDLAYAAGDPNDGNVPAAVASAYTNSVATAASTTLYNLDASISSLVTQNPPNAGTLNSVGPPASSGLLDAAVFADSAFDISGQTGVAFAVLDTTTLIAINLTTREVTDLGVIGSVAAISGLAVLVPEPTGMALLVFAGIAGTVARRRRTACASR